MAVKLHATTVHTKDPLRAKDLASVGDSAGRGTSLEVLEGPMDGLVLTGDFERIKIGRTPGNDLELHSDRSVSSNHAILQRDPVSGWQLEDLKSTNGTWVDSRRLSPGDPVPVDDVFMIGHSVIRLQPAIEATSFLPDADHLYTEMARLSTCFTPETAEGYGAAVAMACGELKPFLSDRHFFLGLVTMNPGLAILARNEGPIPPGFLADALRRNELWTGPQAWIHRQLRALAIETGSLFEDDLVATPRLLRLLLLAEEAARGAAGLIRPEDVLRAYFAGPANRPRDLLARAGIAPEALLPLVNQPVAGRPLRTEAPRASPPEPAPVRQLSSGQPALDARAQEVARGLYGVASLYHLAAAEDRREAMRQYLVQEVAQVQSDGRQLLLRQVQRLFPIAAGPVLDFTMAALPDPTSKKPKRPPAPEPPSPSPSGGLPWRLVLEGQARGDAMAGLGTDDRAAAELFAELLSFATALERFIVSVVQNLRSPGMGTETLQLPGARTSIPRHTRELLTGKSPRRETLKEYLGAVEAWLVSAVAAYHEAPDLWFKDFWRKVSPAAIESPLAEENKKRLLSFGTSLEYWNRYKERVRTVSPDLVSDEILHIVRRRVDEQYNQLFERRKS
jgi:hypothetical protein